MADLTIRDWMVVIGVLLILAVLLDAWRRVKRERNSRVRMKLREPPEYDSRVDEDLARLKELPNGGARVVRRGDQLHATGESAEGGQAPAESAEVLDDGGEPLVSGVSAGAVEDEEVTWKGVMRTGEKGGGADTSTGSAGPDRLPRDGDSEVFMLNVVARDPRGFKGEDILHILLACDLRFGDMNFFHRHELAAGKGAIQFSVANMMQPGVFDIDNMSDFSTPGLVFFLTLPGPEDMMQAFDFMLETAQTVARNLGGDVLDESRSFLTRQTVEHNRQQIRDLERRLLARAR